MARKVNLPLRGVIENMSWFTGDDGNRYQLFGEGGGADAGRGTEVPLLGQIPLVPALREGGDEGRRSPSPTPRVRRRSASTDWPRRSTAQGRARIRRGRSCASPDGA